MEHTTEYQNLKLELLRLQCTVNRRNKQIKSLRRELRALQAQVLEYRRN